MVFTKINFSLLTGLVIAAGILTRKEAIMIQTEIVKEIVRLQAATANLKGEFKELKTNELVKNRRMHPLLEQC